MDIGCYEKRPDQKRIYKRIRQSGRIERKAGRRATQIVWAREKERTTTSV